LVLGRCNTCRRAAAAHHWKLTGDDGQPYFVTVDDLDDKNWMGDMRATVFEGLGRALSTAVALRHEVGLEFVVAPIPAAAGQPLIRLDDRYTVSVSRSWLAGPIRSAPTPMPGFAAWCWT
jgi:hypothetical protein